MNINEKEIESEQDETLLEFQSRSGLDAIVPFPDRSDDLPRDCDLEFDGEGILVHEDFPKDA